MEDAHLSAVRQDYCADAIYLESYNVADFLACEL